MGAFWRPRSVRTRAGGGPVRAPCSLQPMGHRGHRVRRPEGLEAPAESRTSAVCRRSFRRPPFI